MKLTIRPVRGEEMWDAETNGAGVQPLGPYPRRTLASEPAIPGSLRARAGRGTRIRVVLAFHGAVEIAALKVRETSATYEIHIRGELYESDRVIGCRCKRYFHRSRRERDQGSPALVRG